MWSMRINNAYATLVDLLSVTWQVGEACSRVGGGLALGKIVLTPVEFKLLLKPVTCTPHNLPPFVRPIGGIDYSLIGAPAQAMEN
jgi:hypothetical protein